MWDTYFMLIVHSQGALFLFFAGRIEEVRGNIDEVRDQTISWNNCLSIDFMQDLIKRKLILLKGNC